MKHDTHKAAGVTLLEILLVLVILATMVLGIVNYFIQKNTNLRVEKTVEQLQLILNAATAFYVKYNAWPGGLVDDGSQAISCLQGNSSAGPNCGNQVYLPTSFNDPFGYPYTTIILDPNQFGVSAQIGSFQPGKLRVEGDKVEGKVNVPQNLEYIANLIASKMPLAYMSYSSKGGMYVNAQLNIPAQVLNQATSVKFAGLYNHGGCVPIPSCPQVQNQQSQSMVPQIMVIPVSISGLSYAGSRRAYPITGFTAYATVSSPADTNPPACQHTTMYSLYSGCDQASIGGSPPNGYWRVCVQITTTQGDLTATNNSFPPSTTYPFSPWGGNMILLAITRCAINNEPAGSSFSVYSN